MPVIGLPAVAATEQGLDWSGVQCAALDYRLTSGLRLYLENDEVFDLY